MEALSTALGGGIQRSRDCRQSSRDCRPAGLISVGASQKEDRSSALRSSALLRRSSPKKATYSSSVSSSDASDSS